MKRVLLTLLFLVLPVLLVVTAVPAVWVAPVEPEA